ncbi:MAG TPA: methylenetetrahydrofolate reductase [Paenirhodobacter sp.]
MSAILPAAACASPPDRSGFLRDATIEMTAKDIAKLSAAVEAGFRPRAVFIPALPGEDPAARIAAIRAVAGLGIEPVPHISARRLGSQAELDGFLDQVCGDAGVRRLLIVGGDPTTPHGPFADSRAVIRALSAQRRGLRRIGLAGHPEGHPDMPGDQPTQVLAAKIGALADDGVESEIVTQFSFDSDRVADWIAHLRANGILVPVAIGLPGPTRITTLLKFAARCGVGASAKVVAKYGFSLTRVLGSAGPETFIDGLLRNLDRGAAPETTANVRAHLYPFGGFAETAQWLTDKCGPQAQDR